MICLDTGALITAVQPALTCELKRAWRPKLRAFLDGQGKNLRLMVPAVVMAEYLYGIPTAEWQKTTADLMTGSFFVAPFSAKIAIKAADLRRVLAGRGGEKKAIKDLGATANKFKADIQVIATAAATDGTLLMTADGGVAQACKQLGVRCKLLDELPEPQEFLF